MDLFNQGAVMSYAYHQPKDLVKFRPGYSDPVDMESIHPMLRPVK
jgi:hypothetical protein